MWNARQIVNFYVSGFKEMTVGKKLWLLIIIKCVIFFAVLKLFFFPDILNRDYDNDDQRARAVMENLTE